MSTGYKVTSCQIWSRALVRAGATGARAPAEIWQQVLGTHPEKDATRITKYIAKNAPKLDTAVSRINLSFASV